MWSTITTITKKPKELMSRGGIPRETPELINNLDHKGVKKIVCGVHHSIVLTNTDKMYAFGKGSYGAMGTGNQDTVSYKNPAEVNFFEKNKVAVKDVVVGEWHSVFLTTDGSVYTCGYGGKSGILNRLFSKDMGALGHGDTDHQLLPRKIKYFADKKIKIDKIAAGRFHTVALSEEGDIYTWGRGHYGTLGTGESKPSSLPLLVESVKDFRKESPENVVTHIDSADSYTVAMTSILLCINF